MADVITRAQLEAAFVDADDLDEIVNGDNVSTVTTRLGRVVSTVAKVMKDAQEALAVTGYLFFPSGSPAGLAPTKLIRLYGSDPTKFYQVKQAFYHDVGNRFTYTISQSTDAAGTGETVVCEFSDGGTGITLTGRKKVDLAAVGGSGITGFAVVDFGNGTTPFAVYDAATTYATAGLPIGAGIPSVDITSTVQSIVDAALLVEAGRMSRGVFVPQVDNDYLEEFITEIGIQGGDKGHQYIISEIETAYFPGIPLWRWMVTIRDLTLGINVCQYTDSSATDPTSSGKLEAYGFADAGNGSFSYVGVQAMIGFDWSKVNWATNLTTYTTAAQSGIHQDNVHSNDDMDSFLWAPKPRKTLTVGASGADFTTIKAACDSLLKFGLVQNNQATALPWSNVCGYTRQVLVKVIDDNYREDLNELIMPPYVTIRGKGIDNTVLTHTSPDTNERLMEFRHSACLEDCTLRQKGPAYIIHADAFNDWSVRALAGPPMQWYRNRKVLRRVKLIADATTGNAWGWGSGISSWEYALFEDCIFSRPQTALTAALIGIHTCPNSVMPATVHFRRCSGDAFYSATDVVLLSGFAQEQRNLVITEDCDIPMVTMGSSFADTASDMPARARQRVAWDSSGNGASSISDYRMEVLKVPKGATVSGTAVTGLLGAGYDQKHGRGEMLIMEESPYRKLGVILGDCTSVNKTLTVNGVTHTFNQNYTAQSEATILAAMNATFGASTVSVVRIDQTILLGDMARTWMPADVAVAAKRFVKAVGDEVVVTSGRPMGFTMEAMAADEADFICTDRRFSAELIPELYSTFEGEFGLVAGVATQGATPAVGTVRNGVVELYD